MVMKILKIIINCYYYKKNEENCYNCNENYLYKE